MLLLGILSSQGEAPAAGAYDLLETQILTSSASSVTFTGLDTLAAGYQHLQIRMSVRSDRDNQVDGVGLRFNGDSGTNYTDHYLLGNGTSVTSVAATALTEIITRCSSGSSVVESFSPIVIDILDFANTSKNTTTRQMYGTSSVSDRIYFGSGLHVDTSAVTSLDIFSTTASNLVTGSRFSIYGIKGA